VTERVASLKKMQHRCYLGGPDLTCVNSGKVDQLSKKNERHTISTAG